MTIKPTVSNIMIKAANMFLSTNPTARLKWNKKPALVTYPTGYRGWYGTFTATAPGYRVSVMSVECDRNGNDMSIR